MTNPTDTNQASEDELRETIERLLRFNCPNGCDGNGSYPEMSADGEWEQGQCQWCFEYGMPARDAIQSLISTEKLKLLDEVRERMVGEDYDIPAEMEKVGRDFQKLDAIAKTGGLLNKFKADLRTKLNKLEAEL